MKKVIKKLRSLSLFLKLTVIILISSISVSTITAYSIINLSKKLFINNFSITNTRILRQIQDNSADLNNSLVTVMNTVNNSWAFRKYFSENTVDPIEQTIVLYNLKQHLKPIEAVLDSAKIDFLAIGVNDSTYLRSSALLTTSVVSIKENKITKTALENSNKLLFQHSNSGFTSLTENKNVIIATKVLCDPNTKQQFGMLYIIINENMFSKLYSNFPTKGNDIFMISSDGTIVSSNRQDLIGSRDENLLHAAKKIYSEKIKYMDVKADKKSYTVLSNYMPIYDFYLVNRIDTKLALDEMYNINEIIIICGLIIATAVAILFMITRKTTKPLRILVKEMSKITDYNFKNHIDLQGSYEIEKLSKSFNIMLDDLNDYVEKLVVAQKKQRQAELSALQMQINPHFIYNTLASIKWLILKGDNEKASETINSFISLLQNTISDTSETITVEQEMENLKNYVFINETRYGENIKVNFHILPQCLHYRLPKLILQPFIENSFFHAFNGDKEGRIHVFVSEKNGNLFCEIVDNGTGIAEDRVLSLYSKSPSKSKHFTGIGIKNVDDRIKMLYGDEYGIKINSEVGVGTTINVYLPLIE